LSEGFAICKCLGSAAAVQTPKTAIQTTICSEREGKIYKTKKVKYLLAFECLDFSY